MSDFTRRELLIGAGLGAAALQDPDEFLRPATRAKPRPPIERVRFAGIGVGGMGGGDVDAVVGSGGQLVALCDVDQSYAAKKFQQYPDAKKFVDFRKMLDELDKEIDAVVIGTPDHTHAVIAMEAMERGKHVYCEKPLTRSIHDARKLMDAARKHKVVTQLGNQGHSSNSIREVCELVWSGAIGDVHTVHAGCDAFKEVYSQKRNLDKLNQKYDVPAGLDYDLWLGPAEFRPYAPFWVPWNWRGWLPFGTGTIGDWICHVVDPSFWALDLGAPTTVRAEVKDWDPAAHGLTYPPGSTITFEFPAKGPRGPVKLVWHDGDSKIPKPSDWPASEAAPGTGAILFGTKGQIRHGSHGAGGWYLFPEALNDQHRGSNAPAQKIERVRGHQWDWLEAIKTGREAGSSFEYGARLTQIALIGLIALKFPGETLEWDDRKARFTNNRAANDHVNPPVRKGWKL